MKREDFSVMIFPFGYDMMKGTMSVQDVFELTARKGFSMVDVLGIDESLQGLCRSSIDSTGVSIYCFIANLNFFQPQEDLKKDLKSRLSVAKALDSKRFMVVPYNDDSQLAKAQTLDKSDVQQRMIDGFRLAVEAGKEYGLPVCFETTPHDSLALSGTQDCAYVLDQVPGLGLVFDTSNMLPHGDETLEAYEALKDRIVYVHLKDVALEPMDPEKPLVEHTKDGQYMRGVVWGEGVIPVKEVASRLLRDGYSGPFALEYAHPGIFTAEAHEAQLDKFMAYMGL